MNFTAQGLSASPLLGSTKLSASSAVNGVGESSDIPVNPLNNKDFSDILDGQKTLSNPPEKNIDSPFPEGMVELNTVVGQQSVLALTEPPVTLFADSDGKSLPIEGFLPSTTTIVTEITEGEESQATESIGLSVAKGESLDQVLATERGGNTESNTGAVILQGTGDTLSGNQSADNTGRGGLGHQPVTAGTTMIDARSNRANFDNSGMRGSVTTVSGESISSSVTTNDKTRIVRSLDGTVTNNRRAAAVNSIDQNLTGHRVSSNTPSSFMMEGPPVTEQLTAGILGSLDEQLSKTDLVNKMVSDQLAIERGAFNNTVATTIEPGIQNSIQATVRASAPVISTAVASTTVTSTPIDVGKPGWGETVMQRVMWMSSQNINKAEIALDPPELGPLQVKISTQGDQTSVVFSSHHGAVRDALDQSLYRLREMMEDQGLDLADVDVSDQQQAESEQSGTDGKSEGEQAATEQRADGEPMGLPQKESIVASSLALVDQYV